MTESETPVLTPEGFIEKEWDCGCRVCTKLKNAALVAVEMARKEQFSICKEILLESDKNWINQMQKDRQDMAEIINGEKNETALLIFQELEKFAMADTSKEYQKIKAKWVNK